MDFYMFLAIVGLTISLGYLTNVIVGGGDDPYGYTEEDEKKLAHYRAVVDRRMLKELCEKHGELDGVAEFERRRVREKMVAEDAARLDQFVNDYLQERNKEKK